LTRFDSWAADADIANGIMTLKENQVQQGSHKRAVEATLTLGNPPRVSFKLPNEVAAKRR
jgi:hypothetical protein